MGEGVITEVLVLENMATWLCPLSRWTASEGPPGVSTKIVQIAHRLDDRATDEAFTE